MKRKNEKDHYAKKNAGSAELFKKQKKERNAARGKQRWVSSSFVGTIEELDALSNEQIRAIVPAHWERP